MNSLDCKMTAVACGTWPKSLVLMMSCPRFFLSTITKAGTNQDFPIWINVPAVNKSLVNVLSVEKKQPLNVHNVLFSTCHIIYESFSYIQVMSTPKLVGTLSKSVNPIKFNCPNKLNQKIGSKWTYLSSLECCHLISVKLENEEGKKKCEASWKEELSKGLSRAQNADRRVCSARCSTRSQQRSFYSIWNTKLRNELSFLSVAWWPACHLGNV